MFDVVVVGGGMVGASLALKFSQDGLNVALLEKFPPADLPTAGTFDLRVSAINRRSERWLTELGAWQQIPLERRCPYLRLQAFEQDPAQALTFTAAEIQQPHLGHIIENNQLQAALWQQFPPNLTLYCPATITGLQQHATHASLQTLEFGQIDGRLLIAADGGHSQLRQLAGIGCQGWQYQQGCLVATVETAYSQQDITWQQFTEQGPRAFLPLPGERASLVWYEALPRVQALAALPATELTQEIKRHFPPQLGDIKVQQQSWFALTRMHANHYSAGRVVLVGDAAHTINPLAGQGVNLGFADAQVLAKLVLAAYQAGHDLAAAEVFAKYEQERRKANLIMMTAMDAMYQVFSHSSPLVRLARKTGLQIAANAGPLKSLVGKYAAGLA